MIRNLQHLALTVPDVEAGRRFYEAFGLQAGDRGDRLALRCAGRDQDQILLNEGRERRVHHLSFGTTASESPDAKTRLEAGGSGAPARNGAIRISQCYCGSRQR